MTFHSWQYKGPERWVCDYCKGTTKNPTIGTAAKATCPGKKK